MKLTIISFVFLFATTLTNHNVQACSEDGRSGILEENDVNIPVGANMKGGKVSQGISEEEFHHVVAELTRIYTPIVNDSGAKLDVRSSWRNGTVNAYASRSEDTWIVQMFGGLARHSAITSDGFALVLCHELGHHLAGTPLTFWASNEGQSDYYATLKCLRRYYEEDPRHDDIVRKLNPPATVVNKCSEQWNSQFDRSMCIRSSMAGLSVANLFRALRRDDQAPSFDRPDPNQVENTQNGHPATQCRLDTYFQGALCTVDHNEPVSKDDEVQGTCHILRNDNIGLRPQCWFKPQS